MKELTIRDIETIVHRDECRVMEAKKTTGEIKEGMQSGCAFLNTDGGWLFFGTHSPYPTLHLRRQAVLESGKHHDAYAKGDVRRAHQVEQSEEVQLGVDPLR